MSLVSTHSSLTHKILPKKKKRREHRKEKKNNLWPPNNPHENNCDEKYVLHIYLLPVLTFFYSVIYCIGLVLFKCCDGMPRTNLHWMMFSLQWFLLSHRQLVSCSLSNSCDNIFLLSLPFCPMRFPYTDIAVAIFINKLYLQNCKSMSASIDFVWSKY